MANVKRLILLFCFCFVDNLNISGAIKCYVCEKCHWKDGSMEECKHSCQSVSNPDGSLTKRCSTDLHATLKCQYNKNCTCASDLCNGIASKPGDTGNQTVASPEAANFHFKLPSGIIPAFLGERTNVVLERHPTNNIGRIKRAIKRIYYKSPQVTKTTGSLITSVQTHKDLNTEGMKNTGNAARISVEMSSSHHTGKSSLTTHIRYNRSPTEGLNTKIVMPMRTLYPSEPKIIEHSIEHYNEISDTKSIDGDISTTEDSGFIEELLNVSKGSTSRTTGKRFHSTKITSNSITLPNKGVTNLEHHTLANEDVTDSPNSRPYSGITTDKDSSGMATREFPFWPSPSLPAIDSNSASEGTFTKAATVSGDSKDVSSKNDAKTSHTIYHNFEGTISHKSGHRTTNHHIPVTLVQTSETLLTNEEKTEKSSASWTRNGRNTPESTIISTLQPEKTRQITLSSFSTPYAENESQSSPTTDILFVLESAAKLNGEDDKYQDNELSNEQEMGIMSTIWVVIGSLCLLVILIGLVMLFVKIFRKNKTYVIN